MESDADDPHPHPHHHLPPPPLHHIATARIVSRDDCWSEGATSVLIDAWGERYLEMSRGNLKQSHWNEVAEIVRNRGGRGGGGGGGEVFKAPKTDVQCKNRIDTVKKKYKAEKAKVDAGGPPSRWPFFERMERLIAPAGKKGANSVETKESAGQLVPVGVPVGVRAVPVDYYYPKQRQVEVMATNVSKGFSGRKWPQPQPLRKRLPVEMDSESDDDDSADSLPTETYMRRKRPAWEFNHCNVARAGGFGGGCGNVGGLGAGRNEKDMAKEEEEKVGWGQSVREVTKAILKFGETYEAAENAKLQQMVEMEKERMKFTKELEVQRMKLLIKTQLELSQLARKNGRVREKNIHQGSNNNHCGNNNDVSSD